MVAEDDALQGIIQALADQQLQQNALSRMVRGYGYLGEPTIAGISEPAYMTLASNEPSQQARPDPIGSQPLTSVIGGGRRRR